MRDLVAQEALKVMARDASKRLRELVAQGEQLPYDVREAEASSPLPQYVPLTERFIRDHSQALSAMDSFGAACAAIESAELSSAYLESFGIGVPGEARKRGELAGVVFLCRLWAGSTDFSLEAGRLESAIAELEAGGEIAADEIEVIIPLRGLHMPVTRLELATATIVRTWNGIARQAIETQPRWRKALTRNRDSPRISYEKSTSPSSANSFSRAASASMCSSAASVSSSLRLSESSIGFSAP
jgi:hypothetical protein